MPDETIYRGLLLAALVLALPIGVYHRMRARVPGERLDRKQEGWFILITLRLLGFAGATLTCFYLAHPDSLAWAYVPLPDWARACGTVLVFAAAGLLAWVFHFLGKNLTDTVVTRAQHTLITDGPYRYVRHPFYLVLLVGASGVTLLTARWIFAPLALAAFTLLVIRCRKEEENLELRFGDDYRAYRRRTPAFLPGLLRESPTAQQPPPATK
jgi:protein-S-isoprenylcysteine O-methyltransferase Ste14